MAPFALTSQLSDGSPEPVEKSRGLSELLRPGIIQPKLNGGGYHEAEQKTDHRSIANSTN